MKKIPAMKFASLSLLAAGAFTLGSPVLRAQDTPAAPDAPAPVQEATPAPAAPAADATPAAPDSITPPTAVTPPTGMDAAKPGAPLSAKDKAFVMKAGGGNLAEVKLGELAQTKSENPEVKSFGEMMVTDHGKANTELGAVAAKKGLTFEPKLPAKAEATMKKLAKLTGAAFDKAYIADAVMDHTEDVAEYKAAIATLKDEDLKNYATTTLPIIQHHLEMAKEDKAKTSGAAPAKKK